jgi:hypothetical protein
MRKENSYTEQHRNENCFQMIVRSGNKQIIGEEQDQEYGKRISADDDGKLREGGEETQNENTRAPNQERGFERIKNF